MFRTRMLNLSQYHTNTQYYILGGSHIGLQDDQNQNCQFILFPTAKNVGINTLESNSYIVYCATYCQKQLLDGVHFATQDGGVKSFPFKWKHCFCFRKV